jgi:hypothetical protein
MFLIFLAALNHYIIWPLRSDNYFPNDEPADFHNDTLVKILVHCKIFINIEQHETVNSYICLYVGISVF